MFILVKLEVKISKMCLYLIYQRSAKHTNAIQFYGQSFEVQIVYEQLTCKENK